MNKITSRVMVPGRSRLFIQVFQQNDYDNG